MKPILLIVFLTLAATTWSAAAAPTDRSYYVTELSAPQRFDVYNDGHNTYLESIPGLVVTGATAEGERYIVTGVPQQIRGFMNGKPITVVRGTPPAPKPPIPDPAVVNAQIKRLTEKLDSLSSKVQPKATPPVALAVATHAPGVANNSTAPAMLAAVGTTSDGAFPLGKGRPVLSNSMLTYRVSPNDENLRVLINRWAATVGWTAVWDVERDILINNAGEKYGDFKTSVRWLLAATELGDLVVKPCFYSNSVVRVVRKTVKCNPNE